MEQSKMEEKILDVAKKVRQKEHQSLEQMTPEQLKAQMIQNNKEAEDFAKQYGINTIHIKSEAKK